MNKVIGEVRQLLLFPFFFFIVALSGCGTKTYEPKTIEGAQCKMQCSTSVDMGLGGMPYIQKMNTCLDACADMERIKAKVQ
jgi:hypothetical protein